MELKAVGAVLRARRWLVLLGLVLAVMLGTLLTYQVKLGLPPKLISKEHYIGQAAGQVLIDTPNSQIVDLNAQNPDIYNQANLLADVMATTPVQRAISSDLNIPAGELVTIPPPSSIAVPIRATPLALAGEKSPATAAWKMGIQIDPSLPIIAFSATAPSPQQAQALVADAIKVLGQKVDAVAGAQHIPDARRLVINTIDPPASAALAVGTRKLYGIGAAVVVFFLFNFAIVMVGGRRARRDAAPDRDPRAQQAPRTPRTDHELFYEDLLPVARPQTHTPADASPDDDDTAAAESPEPVAAGAASARRRPWSRRSRDAIERKAEQAPTGAVD